MQASSVKLTFFCLFLLSWGQVCWFVDGKAPSDMEIRLENSIVKIEGHQQFTYTETNGSFTYVSSSTVTISPRSRSVSEGDNVVYLPDEQANKGGEFAAAPSSHGPSPSSSVNTSDATRQHVNTPESASNLSVIMPSEPCENEPRGEILGQVNQPEVPTGAKVETGAASITTFSARSTVDQSFDKLAAEASLHSSGGPQPRTHASAVSTPNPHLMREPLPPPPGFYGHAQGYTPAEVSNSQCWYWCLWAQAV